MSIVDLKGVSFVVAEVEEWVLFLQASIGCLVEPLSRACNGLLLLMEDIGRVLRTAPREGATHSVTPNYVPSLLIVAEVIVFNHILNQSSLLLIPRTQNLYSRTPWTEAGILFLEW